MLLGEEGGSQLKNVLDGYFDLETLMQLLKTGMLAFITSISSAAMAQLGEAPMPKISPPVASAIEPSLDQTTAWMAEKISQASPISWRSTQANGFSFDVYQRIYFEGCTAFLVYQDKGGFETLSRVVIELKDIDLDNSYAIEDTPLVARNGTSQDGTRLAAVAIKTIGQQRLFVRSQYKDTPSWEDSMRYYDANGVRSELPAKALREQSFHWAYVYFPNIDLAERWATAMRHASTLCIKQSADSKARQAKKSNELF